MMKKEMPPTVLPVGGSILLKGMLFPGRLERYLAGILEHVH
jgi:hypothetical protein